MHERKEVQEMLRPVTVDGHNKCIERLADSPFMLVVKLLYSEEPQRPEIREREYDHEA